MEVVTTIFLQTKECILQKWLKTNLAVLVLWFRLHHSRTLALLARRTYLPFGLRNGGQHNRGNSLAELVHLEQHFVVVDVEAIVTVGQIIGLQNGDLFALVDQRISA